MKYGSRKDGSRRQWHSRHGRSGCCGGATSVRRWGRSTLLSVGLLVISAAVCAQNGSADAAGDGVFVEKSQWEVGIAGGSLQAPAYPSSSVKNERSFAVPWFIYRGPRVRLQDGGVKVIAVESDRLTVDVSLGGSLNADSSKTPLRSGMPDLDYLFELGPKLEYRFFDRSHGFADNSGAELRSRLTAEVALRGVIATDFSSARSRGFVLNTELGYRYRGLFGARSALSLSLNSVWATEKLMDYFYQVDEAFVSASRPQFDAGSGYLGSSLSIGMSRKFGKRLLGFAGVTRAFAQGSANADSPLFERDATTSLAVGLSWSFWRSDATVRLVDE